ncbi:hypothetical protein B9G55_20325 [Saccharibacillus sp. O16]|nr:hypothetical protein B9G55_20325 [Saccharibacillus sp. O16]
MKVAGVILNILAILWAAMGLMLMLVKSDNYTQTEDVVYATILFYIPALFVLLVGSLLVYAGNQRKLHQEKSSFKPQEDVYSVEEAADYEVGSDFCAPRPEDDAKRRYRESNEMDESPRRSRDIQFAPPDARQWEDQEKDQEWEQSLTGANSYRADRLDKPDRPAAGTLVEEVCLSCGTRKTMRAGTSVPCDHCGSTVTAD